MLVVSYGNIGLFVYPGKGDGTFDLPTTLEEGLLTVFSIADFNGDGLPTSSPRPVRTIVLLRARCTRLTTNTTAHLCC